MVRPGVIPTGAADVVVIAVVLWLSQIYRTYRHPLGSGTTTTMDEGWLDELIINCWKFALQSLSPEIHAQR